MTIQCKGFSKSLLTSAMLLSAVNVYAAGGGEAPAGSGANQFGAASVWASSIKQGIGTSYEKYSIALDAFGHSDTGAVSKVWFSLAEGIVTETAWGLIHEKHMKDMQFLITGTSNGGWFDEERVDTNHSVTYISTDSAGRPTAPSYRIVNTDKQGRYTITKDVFTDPDRQTLIMHVTFQAFENGVTPYLLVNPHMDNTGNQDVAFSGTAHLGARNVANNKFMVVKSNTGFIKTSAAYVGVNDGWNDLVTDRIMNNQYEFTSNTPGNNRGNVALTAQFATVNTATTTFDVALGFGSSFSAAETSANGSLGEGYATLLNKYNGVGSYTGWQDYIASLTNLGDMVASTGDNGKLLYNSALMLKSMEDKSNAGALIACFCVPWGESVSADNYATGYQAVWVRDFFQVGMAMLALGDTQTAKVAFKYLPRVQVTAITPGVGSNNQPGWFLQKTHVNGTLEWTGLQKDQAAMPAMYGLRLWQAGVLSNSEITSYYHSMLKPAAEFLSHTSTKELGSNGTFKIFNTEQERWEEASGKSPSNNAAVIAGLIATADIAEFIGGSELGAAGWYRQKADAIYNDLNDMYTTSGYLGDGNYFYRINVPGSNDLCIKNGGDCVSEKAVLDGGFLELVRYGVLEPDDKRILESLEEYNSTKLDSGDRVRYNFNFGGVNYPAWRRYSQDHYGEKDTDCSNFAGDNSANRGRPWPFFTGEYGSYEIDALYKTHGGVIPASALTTVRNTYARAMEYFANDTYLLPEQIYDGQCDSGGSRFTMGKGTNSATPLAWPHAEYIKLVRSIRDGKNFSKIASVDSRYPLTSSTVAVTFQCSNGITSPGQSIYVVGNIAELGNWSLASAKKLDPTSYPTWSAVHQMPPSTTIEWKGIKRWENFGSNPSVNWEPGNNNVLTTPASGAMTITNCQF